MDRAEQSAAWCQTRLTELGRAGAVPIFVPCGCRQPWHGFWSHAEGTSRLALFPPLYELCSHSHDIDEEFGVEYGSAMLQVPDIGVFSLTRDAGFSIYANVIHALMATADGVVLKGVVCERSTEWHVAVNSDTPEPIAGPLCE